MSRPRRPPKPTPWQVRRHYLLAPFFKGFGLYLAGYTLTTVLLRPWGLEAAWSVLVPLLAGLALAAWLWRPWGILAPDSKGTDSRLGMLIIVLLLCTGAGWSLRQLLYARLGEVRDLHSVQELKQPGNAVFFRLHGPFYADQPHRGEYTDTSQTSSKGKVTYYAHYYYACPLLAAPADGATPAAPVAAWLGYSETETLGKNLPANERQQLAAAFFARCQAQPDTARLKHFTYLERAEDPGEGLRTAVWRSPLSPGPPYEALILTPVTESFGQRGLEQLFQTLGMVAAGSALVVMFLLATDLRPASEWPD